MQTEEFNKVLDESLDKIKKVLVKKADEYATEDRLHNFKVAGVFQGITPEAALLGMLSKHLVSVAKCVREQETNLDLWDEKLIDSLNYFVLLRALVIERIGKSK